MISDLFFETFLSGIVAGYGIAIPVGPIDILILELGLWRGFRIAFIAGVGAATADLIYATTAVISGTFLVSVLLPFAFALRIVSSLGLIIIGGWLLYHSRNPSTRNIRSRFRDTNCAQTYVIFLGLTILNPVTVIYFTTLILGMAVNSSLSSVNAAFFVAGVFLASLSWLSLLACMSGLGHRRLPAKVQTVTFIIGNCVIILLGVAVLLGLRA